MTTDYGITIALDAVERTDPVDLRPAGPRGVAGQRPDHDGEPDPRSRPSATSTYDPRPTASSTKLSVLAERPRAARLAGADHAGAAAREADGVAQHRRRATCWRATGGYIGDALPYVGHVVVDPARRAGASSTSSTRSLRHNCRDHHRSVHLFHGERLGDPLRRADGPSSSRAGTRILIATGNAPYNGTTNFGDSVIELRRCRT